MTIFEKIIAREIPSHIVYEDAQCIAILDAFPTMPGQTLVIPKEPIDYAFELNDATYQHLMGVAKRLALALDVAFTTIRTCLVIEGLEVPHAHIKLYPLTEPELTIHGGRAADEETLAGYAEKIKGALEERTF